MVIQTRVVSVPERHVILPEALFKELLSLLPAAHRTRLSSAAKIQTQHVVKEEERELPEPSDHGGRINQSFYKPGSARRKEGSLGRFG